MELIVAKKKEQFTGDENALKEAAVLLIRIMRREEEVKVSPYLSRNDPRLLQLKKEAKEWMKRNIK